MAHQQAVPAPNHRRRAVQSQTSYPDGVVRIAPELLHQNRMFLCKKDAIFKENLPRNNIFGILINFFKKIKKISKKVLTMPKRCGIIVKLSRKAVANGH